MTRFASVHRHGGFPRAPRLEKRPKPALTAALQCELGATPWPKAAAIAFPRFLEPGHRRIDTPA
jgi:hypothetical protein